MIKSMKYFLSPFYFAFLLVLGCKSEKKLMDTDALYNTIFLEVVSQESYFVSGGKKQLVKRNVSVSNCPIDEISTQDLTDLGVNFENKKYVRLKQEIGCFELKTIPDLRISIYSQEEVSNEGKFDFIESIHIKENNENENYLFGIYFSKPYVVKDLLTGDTISYVNVKQVFEYLLKEAVFEIKQIGSSKDVEIRIIPVKRRKSLIH